MAKVHECLIICQVSYPCIEIDNSRFNKQLMVIPVQIHSSHRL